VSEVASGYDVLITATFIFGLALISLSMALSTLFQDSKLAPQVGMFLLLLPSSMFFYVFSQRAKFLAIGTLSNQLFPLTYLAPHFSFGVIMLEFYVKGGPESLLNLDVNVAWISLLCSIPLYLLAYMYLDAVIPNAYGIRESPLFCLKCRQT
jgi:hypothetical protein